jgi:hypothetical protein
MEFVKDVVDRVIVVIEVLSSELGFSGALPQEVRGVLVLLSTEWALVRVGLLHLVRMIVEPAV